MISEPKSCVACDRLWADYSQVAAAHVNIVARRHKAAMQSDSTELEEIAAMEGALAEQEIKARRAIEEHEAEHEPA